MSTLNAGFLSVCLAFLPLTFTAVQAKETQSQSRIQEVVSPGGITAWLVEERSIPIVSFNVEFEGGTMLDPEGKEGIAGFAAALIEEGAGDMDSQDWAAALEELSSGISFSTGRDSFSVSMSSLSENVEPTFELMRIALTDPHFDAVSVERVREQLLSGLRAAKNDPGSIASKRWYGDMFGPETRLGRSSTEEIVKGFTREDILEVYAKMPARGHMTIGVVGDIDAATLGPLLDKTFSDLPEGEPLDKTPIKTRETGGIVVIEEDVPQSTVMFGHSSILRDDPDFIPAYVMNYVLGGGGLTSRLTEEVRDKNGLAYSVYSYLNPLERAGLYMGGVATQNARVGQSLELIKQEWARMAEGGLSAEELDGAKKYLTGAWALRFDSNAKIAGFLVGAQSAGLPIDYIDTRNDLVEAVTLDDISRVAKRLLRPDDLFVVVVGKPENLKSADSLEAAMAE